MRADLYARRRVPRYELALVHAYDVSDRRKQAVAQELVRKGAVSPAARPGDLTALLDALDPNHVIVSDAGLVRRAVGSHAGYELHSYDEMIVAAAERGRCGRIWSEDLKAGQQYFGITVENPFAER